MNMQQDIYEHGTSEPKVLPDSLFGGILPIGNAHHNDWF